MTVSSSIPLELSAEKGHSAHFLHSRRGFWSFTVQKLPSIFPDAMRKMVLKQPFQAINRGSAPRIWVKGEYIRILRQHWGGFQHKLSIGKSHVFLFLEGSFKASLRVAIVCSTFLRNKDFDSTETLQLITFGST